MACPAITLPLDDRIRNLNVPVSSLQLGWIVLWSRDQLPQLQPKGLIFIHLESQVKPLFMMKLKCWVTLGDDLAFWDDSAAATHYWQYPSFIKRRTENACWKRWGLVVWIGTYGILIIKTLSSFPTGICCIKTETIVFFQLPNNECIYFLFTLLGECWAILEDAELPKYMIILLLENNSRASHRRLCNKRNQGKWNKTRLVGIVGDLAFMDVCKLLPTPNNRNIIVLINVCALSST